MFNAMAAYNRAMMARAAGKSAQTFDWCKAARILKERRPEDAVAGLLEDWSATAGTIWEGGAPVTKSYAYLSSLWAVPALKIDDEYIECYTDESESGWGSSTLWPSEALAILDK